MKRIFMGNLQKKTLKIYQMFEGKNSSSFCIQTDNHRNICFFSCFFFYLMESISYHFSYAFCLYIKCGWLLIGSIFFIWNLVRFIRNVCVCMWKKSRNPKKKTLLLRNILIKCKLRRKKNWWKKISNKT